ncbi:MAG: GNAT family N-acetyltransferase [Gemmatimonadota bacterium]|nr:GNAT family N-acetyltransferase [Gemmatimonadota bacterium]
MTVPFIVREASTDEDIAQVRALVRAHGDARASTPGVEYVYADAAGLPGPYVQPHGGLWLAVADSTGIGCVALRPVDERSAEVKRMFVDARWRGRGVGRSLLQALITGARERDYSTLRLGTLDDMNAAQALYRSLGFRPIDRYRGDELIDTRFFELDLTLVSESRATAETASSVTACP